MRKIVLLLLIFYPLIIYADSAIDGVINNEKIKKAFSDYYIHIKLNSLEVGEESVINLTKMLRGKNGYHNNYDYVLESIVQSTYGTHALEEHDINRSEKWHARAIKTLIEGKKIITKN